MTANSRCRHPVIIQTLRRETSEVRNSSARNQSCDSGLRPLGSYHQMLCGGNLSQLVSIDDLVSIERQAIFSLSRDAGDRHWERLVLQMANLTCQWTNRKHAIKRRSSQAQYRSNCQHDWNQGDKTQSSKAELGAQGDGNADREYRGKRKRDCGGFAPAETVLQNEVLDHHRRNNGGSGYYRVQDNQNDTRTLAVGYTTPHVLRQQEGACRQRRYNITWKLRFREGKEHDGDDQPDHQECIESIFRRQHPLSL